MHHPIHVLFLLALFLTSPVASAQSVDLTGYWKLDDDKKSTIAVDSTGTSDGIVHGDVKFKINGVNVNSDAIKVNKAGAYIEVPHHDDFLINEGTVAFWFKADTTSGRQGLFSKDSNSYDTGGHLSIYLHGQYLKVRMQSKTTSYELKSKSNINKNKWYHVAFVFGPGGMELYINGQLEKTNSYEGGFGTSSGGTGNFEPLVIGALSWLSGNKVATPTKDHFHGRIDEVAILSNRLISSTITDLYNQTGENGQLSLSDFGGPPPIYYVRTNGSDSNDGLSPDKAFKTIQHAVTKCSQPGITVYVGPGTYNEKIHIGDKNTHKGSVTGTAALPIRLIADITGEFTHGNPGAVILDGQNIENMGFEIKDVEHWTIQGFTIRNQTEYGIYIKNGAASALNCTIEVPRKYAFYAESVGSITIADCIFERDADSAHMIWIYPKSNLTPAADKIIITRNDMTLKGDLYMSTGYEIGWGATRNRQRHNRYIYGVILYTGWGYNSNLLFDEIQITNNQISDSYLPLYSNVMSSKSIPTKVVMANNTIVGSIYSTYSNWDSNDNGIIINNIIDTCFYGTISLNERKAKTLVADKIIENNITYLMARFRRSFEFNIITGNPMFVDAPAGDFSLAKGSPAIDAGINLNAPEIDITGLLRPTDGNNDGVAQVDIGVSELINFGAPTKIKVVQWREISGHRDMSND
ncbi:MAG: right-handed parallel beta-helix repeat-containing protein [Phycisphaerales bacterium]|nr:right-handed parallel beta-helix repeat-containing protein [Phycisphaerales bacterium]